LEVLAQGPVQIFLTAFHGALESDLHANVVSNAGSSDVDTVFDIGNTIFLRVGTSSSFSFLDKAESES
jgi:hypothetical protein